MNILGINGYLNCDHDAGSAIIVDGNPVAAVEEERLVRVKRAPHYKPIRSVKEVLRLSNIKAEEVDIIAYPWSPAHLGADPNNTAKEILKDLKKNGINIRANVPVEFVPHHEAHAWSGILYVKPEERNNCEILVFDGIGENTSGGHYKYNNGFLECKDRFSVESSAGIMYEAASLLSGFSWGQEGKAMGLASYTNPSFISDESVKKLSSKLLNKEYDMSKIYSDEEYNNVTYSWAKNILKISGISPKTFIDRSYITALVQATLESRINEIIQTINSPIIVFVGGTALNCTNNGKISIELMKRGQNLVIPPCANDSGISLGAAAKISMQYGDILGYAKSAMYGRSVTYDSVQKYVYKSNLKVDFVQSEQIAERVASNQVIGWIDGPAEIGPRALGGRSIIANPSSNYLRDKINFLKGRESWRPLAPSITKAEYAKSFTGVANEYMLCACKIRSDAKNLSGVTHVDGTARPQLVSPDQTAYYSLISNFSEITKGPEAIICTSFNMAGEAMVYSISDALHSAKKMNLDAIAGDGWIIDLKR